MANLGLKSITFPNNLTYTIPQVDNTLSIKGAAAEVVAVKEALEGKAPAGYGLGGVDIITLASADEGKFNGWYIVPYPSETGLNTHGWMRVDAYSEEHFTQTVYAPMGANYDTLYVLKRQCSNGVFYPWEWVNPPMYPGVEYRTTERYKNKPIYCKAFNIGALPNSTSKTIENFVEVGCNMLRAEGCAAYTGNNETVPIQTVSTITLRHDTGALIFATTDNYGSWNGFPVVYYWKSN